MSKRKNDEACHEANAWAKLKVDSKGLVHQIFIRQLKSDDPQLSGEEANGNGVEQLGIHQKLGFFQGRSYVYQKTRVPIPLGEPPAGINGLRALNLEYVRHWEGGIDKQVRDFLAQIGQLHAKTKCEEKKFCLDIAIPYEFNDNEATNFGRNLDELLAIPGLANSIGSISYSEGGHLGEMLARFPLLDPNPQFLYRYDIHVYAENDTLVEDYYTDLEHWLCSQWSKPPSSNSDTVRQARLKFVHDREDNAQEMLELLKENFHKAVSPYADRHTFSIRLDCPGFSLDPFHIENEKTGEIMALAYKDETVLKDGNDVDDFEEEVDEPEAKKEKSNGENNGKEANEPEKEDDDDATVYVWKSYKLVRASNGNELERLMAGQLPILKHRISVLQ